MSLRSFIKNMEAQNEVVHITDELSLKFEVSSVTEAFPEGPIFFFEIIKGYPIKIVGNVCSTKNRGNSYKAFSPAFIRTQRFKA